MQQDRLIEPHNDSAVYYLDQARQAGAAGAELQGQVQEVAKRMTQMAHAAIQQRNFGDADKILTEMHNIAAPQASINGVQRELSAARSQQAPAKSEQPQLLELAQSRLALGRLTDPENDNALYYVNLQRVTDPKAAGLAQIMTTLQAQILDRARAALDAGDMEKSEALVQKAATLGASSDLDAMNDRVRLRKAAGGDLLQIPEQSLTRLNKLDIQYPVRALQGNVEGWVEIGYTVGPDGSVSNIKVLNSTPPRTFEASASRAVSHLRYQPVIQNGKPVAVGTQVRIVYRVPK
jgi:TonB family protein